MYFYFCSIFFRLKMLEITFTIFLCSVSKRRELRSRRAAKVKNEEEEALEIGEAIRKTRNFCCMPGTALLVSPDFFCCKLKSLAIFIQAWCSTKGAGGSSVALKTLRRSSWAVRWDSKTCRRGKWYPLKWKLSPHVLVSWYKNLVNIDNSSLARTARVQ